MNHGLLSSVALAAGGAGLVLVLALAWRARTQAEAEGRRTAALAGRTAKAEDQQRQVLAELRAVDVAKELPRWRLAEKIITERSLPWSRLAAELERGLVDGVRLKSIQRTRSADLKVQLKLKGEALSRAAETRFVQALQKNPFFEAVLLEREGEWNGTGVAFECTLAAATVPPPYVPLPRRAGGAAARPREVGGSSGLPPLLRNTPALPPAAGGSSGLPPGTGWQPSRPPATGGHPSRPAALGAAPAPAAGERPVRPAAGGGFASPPPAGWWSPVPRPASGGPR
jgi:hypothetical protein